jgi:phosphopantothenoylcysteine synthetase/decarboxylase
VAAYKAAELVRRLQQERFSVGRHDARGMRFIKPLTFAALTGKK